MVIDLKQQLYFSPRILPDAEHFQYSQMQVFAFQLLNSNVILSAITCVMEMLPFL